MDHRNDPGASEREANAYVSLCGAFGGEPEVKRERDLLGMLARWLSPDEVATLCGMIQRRRINGHDFTGGDAA